MRKIYWIIYLIFFLPYKNFSQNIQWIIPPIIDTLTNSHLDDFHFPLKIKNKIGYYSGSDYLLIPEKYQNYKIHQVNGRFFALIKKFNQWGIYNMYKREVMIGCEFDTIIYKEDLLQFVVTKKNIYGIYDPLRSKWELSPTQKIIYEKKIKVLKNKISYEAESDAFKEASITSPGPIHDPTEEEYLNHTKQPENIYDFTLSDIQLKAYFPNKKILYLEDIGNQLFLIQFENYITYTLWNQKSNQIVIDSILSVKKNNNIIICLFNDGEIAISKTTAQPLTDKYNFKKNTPFDEYLIKQLNVTEKIAVVNHLYGLYSKDYQTIIPFIFDSIEWCEDYNFLYCYKNKSKSIFNLKTKKFIKLIFDYIVHNGPQILTVVKKGDINYTYNNNTDQYYKLPFKIIPSRLPCDSILIINLKNKKYKLYNINQMKYISKEFDYISYLIKTETNYESLRKFKNEYTLDLNNNPKQVQTHFECIKNNRLGLLDRKGKTTFPPAFDSIFAYIETNVSQELKINQYEIIVLYSNGLATIYDLVKNKIKLDSISEFKIQNKPKIHYWYKQHNKWGMFSLMGVININPLYDTFYVHHNSYIFSVNNKYKIYHTIDNKMNDILYDTIIVWPKDYVMVKLNNKYGLYTGIIYELLETKFDSVFMITPPEFKENYKFTIGLKENNLYGFKFKRLPNTPIIFEDYKMGLNQYLWVKQNGFWGLLNKNPD